MLNHTAHQRNAWPRFALSLRDWVQDKQKSHAVRQQQQAQLEQLKRLLAMLDDHALEDVVGVPRNVLEAALQQTPDRALEQVATLMRIDARKDSKLFRRNARVLPGESG